jgi:hypothetical protein
MAVKRLHLVFKKHHYVIQIHGSVTNALSVEEMRQVIQQIDSWRYDQYICMKEMPLSNPTNGLMAIFVSCIMSLRRYDRVSRFRCTKQM